MKIHKWIKNTSIIILVLVILFFIFFLTSRSMKQEEKEESVVSGIEQVIESTTEIIMETFTSETIEESTTESVTESILESTVESTTENDETIVMTAVDLFKYDPADINKDSVIDQEEEHAYLSPEKQACIDAGYGVVLPFNNGEYYMVVTPADGYYNGINGMDILYNYLYEHRLSGTIGAHSSNSEYFWYLAYEIEERITPSDAGFWH